MVRDTLRKVAAQNPDKLRKACEALLDKAVEGDIAAFSQFRDTLDGKPNQSTDVTVFNVTSDRMTDDELANIAAGSSNRASEQAESETPLH